MAKTPRLDSYSPVPVVASDETQIIILKGAGFRLGANVLSNDIVAGKVINIKPAMLDWVVRLPIPSNVDIRVRNSDGKSSNRLRLPIMSSEPIPIPPIPPIPPVGLYGPQEIQQPSGSILIPNTMSIQEATNNNPAGSVFWVAAGGRLINSIVTPKSGNQYIAEYGTILDGSNWQTTNPDDAAFKGLEGDIIDVMIKNFLIKKMPQKGIECYGSSHSWTIEYNELSEGKYGVEFSANCKIKHNKIHHNVGDSSSSNPQERGGGYIGNHSHNALLESNEIAYNGYEQKVGLSDGVAFIKNFVHHNVGDGIWYDTTHNNINGLVEENRVEDNGRDGISLEDVIGGIVRRNICKRNQEGVLLAAAQNTEVYENDFENNKYNISMFIDLNSLVEGRDLRNNSIHHNKTTISITDSFAAILSSIGSGDMEPWRINSKNNIFNFNEYYVTSVIARWMWCNVNMDWNGWQAIPQDIDGNVVVTI